MRHLTPRELVDYVEGALAPDRAAHVDTCADCRSKGASLGDTLSTAQATKTIDVPEPSPLYWEHLSARVREAVAQEDAREAGWLAWLRHSPQAWAAASAALTIALVVLAWRASAPEPGPRPATVASRPAAPETAAIDPSPDVEPDDLNADEAWALVRTLADEVEWVESDDVDFGHETWLTARPGSAERFALSLTPAELSALAQILETELKRTRS
jgi:hypothetical protein